MGRRQAGSEGGSNPNPKPNPDPNPNSHPNPQQDLRQERWANGLPGPPPHAEISALAAQYLEQMLAATEPNDRTLPIPFSRTLYGYSFVGYDELLYKELLKARANNGRIDVDDLGPL